MDDITKDFHLQNVTPVIIKPFSTSFGLRDRFFFIGSCFSEYLYRFLKNNFFWCKTSPFGNTYNPFSIAHTLSLLIDDKKVDDNEVFKHNGFFRHFSFHTKISKPDKVEFINSVNRLIRDAASFLKKTTVLVITFGTAFAYTYRKTGLVVNNCQTLPGTEFKRGLLSIDEICTNLTSVLNKLKEKQKDLFVVFTLSPVRHLRDRAEENSLSKAVLRCAIETLLTLPNTFYFPSFEIMLDELRDYRYYGNDLCHPNDISVHYIMKRFCESCFDKKTRIYLDRIISLRKALTHKPMHPETKEYRKFLLLQEERLKTLCSEYPKLPLPGDSKEFMQRID